jgi:uncharacterized protein
MKKTLYIEGMHCISCEVIIRQKIEEAWYKDTIVDISHKRWNITLELKDTQDLSKIKESIIQAWYQVDWKKYPKKSDNNQWWWKKWLWIVFAWLLVFLLIHTDISKIMPQYTQLTLGIALLIGLVASISTCLAVTGGIVIGYAETISDKNPRKTHLLFHWARIFAFVVGWWLLGVVGGGLQTTIWLSLILNILVWVLLLYLGLQIWGFVPNISRRWIHLPWGIVKYISKIKDPKYAWLVWALTFFVPCGFTQSMQIIALQSGWFWQWGIMMWFFALGTLPVLLGLWLWTGYIKEKIRIFNPIIASLLVAFGVFTLFNGSQLLKTIQTNNNQAIYQSNQETSEVEIVQVGHDWWQFIPSTIILNQGKNYIVRVTPERNWIGCMYALAYWGKSYLIKEGEVFDLYVDGSRKKNIPLVCGMGMRQWLITIK